MTKFFHSEFSNRVFTAGKQTAIFSPYSLAGSRWLGVFKTDDDNLCAALTEAAKNPRSGIREITEDDYLKCEKKMAQASRGYSAPSLIRPAANHSASPVEAGADIATEPKPEAPIEVGAPLNTEAGAINVAAVPPAASEPAIVEKVKEEEAVKPKAKRGKKAE